MTSIQAKIAVAAGGCLGGTVAALIGLNLVSAQGTFDFVTSEVLAIVDSQAKDILLNRAATEARFIRSELDVATNAAQTMAESFAVLAGSSDSATPLPERRAQFNAVLRNVLDHYTAFNGTYSAWEPDALDGNDRAFIGAQAMGSDATGRFLPYWTRGQDGRIAIQPLVEYDSDAAHPNGLMKGGWYIKPKATGKPSLLGPLPYVVQGRQIFLATMSAPIMIDGTFRGSRAAISI
ncbi:cache domain-containing protein [Tistrella bauzanensis]